MKNLISLIIPCYNEEQTVSILYTEIKNVTKELTAYKTECIFVDDGSKDKTLELIKKLATDDENVKYISFSRNFGKEAAMYAGFCNARGDYVAVLDADMQDPPSLLPEMLKILETTDYDSVATRWSGRKGEPPVRSFFAKLFYKIINRISDVDIVDGARDFRLMKRSMADAVVRMSEQNRFSKGVFGWIGFRTYWLPFENVERVAGESKWSFLKLLKYSITGIVNFSDMPLSAITFSGISVLLLSLVLMFVVRGLNVICTVLFICGIQLVALGVIGKYIALICSEVKKRPHYIIAETNDELAERIK